MTGRAHGIAIAALALILGPFPVQLMGGGGLSADGKKVVDYLLNDWKQQFRSTSIPLAMKNLGIDQNDALRLEIGAFLRNNKQLARNLKWWGANNYILSNQEKLIAKYLIHRPKAKGLASLDEVSKATGLSLGHLEERLAFLERAGLLVKEGEHPLGYVLTENPERWGGPLRYNFHTVHVKGEKPFDVW